MFVYSLVLILHGSCYFVRFIERLQQNISGEGVKDQLQALCGIYALSLMGKHLGDFLSTGCITPKQASLANDLLRTLFSKVFVTYILYQVTLSSFSYVFLLVSVIGMAS